VDRDEKWEVIAGQRRVLADLLADLDEEQWSRPSLCAEWRIKDVAAHVAFPPQSPGTSRILVKALRTRGDLQAVNRDMAVEHGSTRSPATLVDELRTTADSRAKPSLTTVDNLMFDTIVHIQDIAVPLGLGVAMPLDAAREGAERVWRMGWPFWARRRFRGLRLTATDVDWSVGGGTEVHGPIQALLLLLTGRTAAAFPQLTGPGTTRLAELAARRGAAR
jgi:uncharacterized protein (TIGR03083 family)